MFSYRDFLAYGDPELTHALTFRQSLRTLFDIRDVTQDVIGHLQVRWFGGVFFFFFFLKLWGFLFSPPPPPPAGRKRDWM